MMIGDLVRLKCGGPIMVIVFLQDKSPDNIVRPSCLWFNTHNEIQQNNFREDLLIKIDPETGLELRN